MRPPLHVATTSTSNSGLRLRVFGGRPPATASSTLISPAGRVIKGLEQVRLDVWGKRKTKKAARRGAFLRKHFVSLGSGEWENPRFIELLVVVPNEPAVEPRHIVRLREDKRDASRTLTFMKYAWLSIIPELEFSRNHERTQGGAWNSLTEQTGRRVCGGEEVEGADDEVYRSVTVCREERAAGVEGYLRRSLESRSPRIGAMRGR
ncbi:hypothetical protein RUND412_004872 [Rhizina undulata]